MVEPISLPSGLRKLIHRLESLPGQLRTIHATPGPVDIHQAHLGQGWHFHENPTALLCLEGALTLQFRERQLVLQAGDGAVIKAATFHRVQARRGSMSLDIGYLSRHADFWAEAQGCHLWGTLPLLPAARLLDDAAQARRAADRQTKTEELIRRIVAEDHTSFDEQSPAIRSMIEALWLPITSDLTARSIIAASGLARAQAYALFTKAYGVGPARAIEDRRIKLAEALLRNGTPIAQVATDCGYHSRSAFTRAWKRRTGSPPGVTALAGGS
ncbi:MAG: AraC family transcriptional regulator [Planctomycetota bacterium]|jgi:AraC-like DNA-binding protein|nr:AraC family transcriptional regulator [Planctomycetota bacterium]